MFDKIQTFDFMATMAMMAQLIYICEDVNDLTSDEINDLSEQSYRIAEAMIRNRISSPVDR